MIKSILMRNWKAHDELQLDFIEGINFLVGPNAAGKTSVLEAICLALLGDLSACPAYADFHFKDLRRDPKQDLEIFLTFSANRDTDYAVTRRVDGTTGRRSAKLTRNGAVVSSAWDDVTRFIMDAFQTNSLFFSRAMFLSEGDTLEYATRPPGEGLTRHIEWVLGLSRLDELRSALKESSRTFSGQHAEASRALSQARALTEAERQRVHQLTTQIAEEDTARGDLQRRIAGVQRSQNSIAAEIQSVEDAVARVRRLAQDWERWFDEPVPSDPLPILGQRRADLERRERQAVAERDRVRPERAALAATAGVQRDIVRLVDAAEEAGQAVCPVCKRGLTPEMTEQIRGDCAREIKRLQEEEEATAQDLETLVADVNRVRALKSDFAELELSVRHILRERVPNMDISGLQSQVESLAEAQQQKAKEMAELSLRLEEAKDRATRMRIELDSLQAKVSQERRDEMRKTQIAMLKGQYTSDLLRESLDDSLAAQRTVVLRPLMAELSRELSRFLGMEVDASFRDNAQLVIAQKPCGLELTFPQLSGGEKTALLVFTQMFLCKYFSRADFMLLDEPLEHLDPDNRRGLIEFLVASGKAGYPKQLVITTFEETLIRQHFGDREVRVTYLSRDFPPVTAHLDA